MPTVKDILAQKGTHVFTVGPSASVLDAATIIRILFAEIGTISTPWTQVSAGKTWGRTAYLYGMSPAAGRS